MGLIGAVAGLILAPGPYVWPSCCRWLHFCKVCRRGVRRDMWTCSLYLVAFMILPQYLQMHLSSNPPCSLHTYILTSHPEFVTQHPIIHTTVASLWRRAWLWLKYEHADIKQISSRGIISWIGDKNRDYIEYVRVIHPDVEIFQSGPQLWTTQSSHTDILDNLLLLSACCWKFECIS